MTSSSVQGRDPVSRGAASAPDEGERDANRPRSNDLALELYRQRTLLQIMTARMRETAAVLERARSVDPARIRRAVDVHRRFLIEVHHADGERVLRAIPRGKDEPGLHYLAEMEKAKLEALEFERNVDAALSTLAAGGYPETRPLARLFQREAERVERFQAWEAETVHGKLDERLAKGSQDRLLAQIRQFDAARIGAEIGLIAWASQLHPSAD